MGRVIDMTGKKVNRLTIIERAGSNNQGKALWRCQCDCGKEIIVNGVEIRNGHTKSCGCYQKDRTSESCRVDIIGKTFGNFTVLEYIQKTEANQMKESKWRCRCNLCGNENALIETTNLKNQYSCGCNVSSHGEKIIEEILKRNNILYVKEKRFSNLVFLDTKQLARFDFFVNNKYLIEFDGRQHFIKGNGKFDNEEKFNRTQEHDAIKNEYCKKNNIPLIRIPYTELNKITLEMLSPETSEYLITG